LTGHASYTNNNLYNDGVVYQRDYVFDAVSSTVNNYSAHQVNLVVAENEVPLYGLLDREYPNLSVSTEVQQDADTHILIPSTFDLAKSNPSQVITGWTRYDNVLVKIYKK